VNATEDHAELRAGVRALDEKVHPDTIRPAKGVHLVVPWEKVRNDIAVVIPVPRDRRSLFVVPWMRRPDGTWLHTYVGTTDTDWKGPLDDPQCTSNDIDYVLDALNASVTTGLTRADVTGTWSGLRPLVATLENSPKGARTADLSRRHQVTTSDNGVVTVTGGKLTTYREMAQDAVNAAQELLGQETVVDAPGGLAERVIGPLARAALENTLQRGQAALTGPVARGDAVAVAAHLAALDEVDPQLAQAYCADSLRTAQRAHAPEEVCAVLTDWSRSPGPHR